MAARGRLSSRDSDRSGVIHATADAAPETRKAAEKPRSDKIRSDKIQSDKIRRNGRTAPKPRPAADLPDEPVVGLGDHVPAFLQRPARKAG